MASHHHLHQPHLHRTHLPPACCCGGGGDFATPFFQTHHPSPQLPPSPSDPLLQALASQILQSAQFHHYSQYPSLRTQKFQSFNPQIQKGFPEQELPQVLHHSTVSSLLSRIEALESSLPRVFYSHVPSQSLRHVAASTIQTHFRAFLVRRSRALRELKDLAIIKSRFESLQSSLSNGFYLDYNAISLEIVDFLLHLDSIQGSDPMVKDSKKCLIRDLVQFLEQIDNFAVKRNRFPLKATKNLRLGQNLSKSRVSNPKLKSLENQKETIEELKSRVEKICERSRIFESDGKDLNLNKSHHVGDDDDEEEEKEESPRIIIKGNNQTRNRNLAKGHQNLQPRVKKSVRFAENGNLSRVLGGSNSPRHEDYGVLNERDSSDDELVEDTCNEAVEIKEVSEEAEDDEEANGDGGGSPEVSDGERNHRRKMTLNGHGGSTFTAPLPLKMENKADLMKNRKSLKILG